MRRLLATAALLLCICATAFAQKEKVVESSAKKAPAWLGISTPEYICVSATAETLDAAQSLCMSDIRQFIINSIAVNVTSTEMSYQNQQARNGVADLLKIYSSQVETKGAAIPYLSGISLSNAEDIYWERRFVRREKRYYCICHVKYPFTEAERRAAIAEFRKIDNGYTERLEELKSNFDTFTDLSYIDRAVSEINPLAEYFFDDVRKSEAEELQRRYRALNGEVAIVPEEASLGSYRYGLWLHGRRVTTDKMPKLKSEYALNLRMVPDGESYVVLYDEQGIEGEENNVEIRYTFGGKTLAHTFTFDPTEGKISVRPCGTVLVEQGDGGEWTVTVELRSRTGNPFVVRAAEVRIAELEPLATAGSVGFRGRGEHHLRFRAQAAATGRRSSAIAEVRLRLWNPSTRIETDTKHILTYKLTVK